MKLVYLIFCDDMILNDKKKKREKKKKEKEKKNKQTYNVMSTTVKY